MRKLSRLSLVAIILAALVILVPTAVLAVDSLTKSVPNTLTIASSNANLKIYSDAAGTVELTGIDWGTIKQGKLQGLNIYLKNEGDYNFSTISATNDFPAAAGLVSVTGNLPLAINALEMVSITVNVLRTAPTGATPFTITFTASY